MQSRALRDRLKNGDPRTIPQLVGTVLRQAREADFPDFFGAQVTLVPVPRSSPVVTGGLWVPLLIAQTMQKAGLGREVSPLLKRVTAVPKSTFQIASARPTVQQHYDSMRAEVLKPAPTRIVLVDDVVTAGCTLLAAASRVAEGYPHAQVRAFALLRTMSGEGVDVDGLIAPCIGTIIPRGDKSWRDP